MAIGQLERFLGDRPELASTPKMAPKNGKKVAVVGSGPSGITCAGELARNGFDVTVFEAFFTGGGVLVYGIPEFRLPKAVVKREIDGLEDMGVKFEYNSVVGNMATAEELFEQGFDAIYVATGAGLPKFLNVPGENLPNVFFANEYLTRVNLMKANKFPEYDTPTKHGKNVVVFGGGNVAMDAVRTAKRLAPSTPSSPTVVPRTRCPAVAPSCTMPRPRASRFCRSSPRSSLSLARTAPCAPSRSRRWSSASPTSPAAVVRCPSRAPSRRSPATSRSRYRHQRQPLRKEDRRQDGAQQVGLHRCRRGDRPDHRSPHLAGGDIVTGAATVILAMGAGKKAAASITKSLLGE